MTTKHIIILDKYDLAPLIKKALGNVINEFVIEGVFPELDLIQNSYNVELKIKLITNVTNEAKT